MPSNKHRVKLALGLVLAFAGAAAAAETAAVTGMARVIDADMLEVDGRRIILFGVDAPERNQPCMLKGKAWDCWAVAARELEQLVANEPVTCEDAGRPDPFRRHFAICRIGQTDINEALVRSGMAMAFARQTKAYLPAQKEAKAARRGLWKSRFIAPWKWRLQRGAPGAR